MSTYEDRAKQLGFAPKDEIKSLSQSEEVVFLDVRGESEIEAEPLGGDFKIVYCPCSRTDATELVNKSSEILPDKSGKLVPSLCCGYFMCNPKYDCVTRQEE